jgi:acetylornithine deacetylase
MTGAALDALVMELGERVEARRDEAVSLLAELVAIRSVNPHYEGIDPGEYLGGESRANEVLRDRYEDAGLATYWVDPDTDRKALVGVREGSGGGRSLILNAHIDTVPPTGGGTWTRGSPWDPIIEGDRLYGLGSSDMKAGGVSMWLAARAFDDLGVRLRGDLQLHSVPGEETGEHEIGTSACVEAGFRADGAIVTEPTAQPRPLSIAIAAAPFIMFKVTVHGSPGDPALRPLAIRPGGLGDAMGVNAVERGRRIVAAIADLEREWGLTKSHPYFPPGFFTIMPGVYRADPAAAAAGSIPHRAEIHWIAYHPPHQSADSAKAEIQGTILDACRLDRWLAEHPPDIEWTLTFPPLETPWEHDLPQAMASAWQRVTGAAVPHPSPAYPANFQSSMDGIWLQRLGIPSIVFGPGDLGVAHSRDEYVSIDETILAGRVLAAAIVEWCGVADDAS